MLDLKDIVTSWATALNPTNEQKILAEKRYEICLGCEYYGKKRPVTGDEYCKKCLCPIQKKIFSQKLRDTCPLGKWKLVEAEYRQNKLKNDKYKII